MGQRPGRAILAAVVLLGVALPAAEGGFADCNGNGIADDVDIAHGVSEDCNANGVPDECEIDGGTSQDCDASGVPDECDTAIAFAAHELLSSAISTQASDLDGDGDLDVVVDFQSAVYWMENDGGGSFDVTHLVDPDLAAIVDAADLDGDGDSDILASYAGEAFWYENLGGRFGPRVQISPTQTVFSWTMPLATADLDGDFDLDVLHIYSFSTPPHRLVWYENLDGAGQFGPPRSIYTGPDSPVYVAVADVDGDGDRDVACAHLEQLVWYVNDGTGSFGPQVLDDGASSVSAGDVDGDGDADLLAVSWTAAASIAWYENLDGLGTFAPRRTVNDDADDLAEAALIDLDGDRDLDVVVLSGTHEDLAWHENLDGRGAFGSRAVLRVTNQNWPLDQPNAGDLDGDGDLDLLQDENEASWLENLSDDCNGNGVPDACEADCNASGIADSCDLAAGASVDCDHDAVPDECSAACTTCNADADVCLDEQDCAPGDGSVWAEPAAASHLRLWGGAPTALSWQPPAFPGAVAVRYDTLRSDSPADFFGGTICLETDGTDTSATDADDPATAQAFYYLIRVENDCPGADGNLGASSDGAARAGIGCR